MRKIDKGETPIGWRERQSTPNAQYERIEELANALIEEQGYLCAYCMRRIDVEHTRIEHVHCQSGHSQEVLDYNNMVICCDGDILGHNNEKEFHCDRKKGERNISFSPTDEFFIDTISYGSKDGEIKSSNEQYDKEMNEVLNLNLPILKRNRFEVLRGVINVLGDRNGKVWKKSDLQRMLRMYMEKKNYGTYSGYREYSGIVIWYLKKKLARLGIN